MCETVDHSEIVYLLPRLAIFVCRLEPTVITVEDEALPLFQHLVRHLAGTLLHDDWLLFLDDLS